MKWLFFVAGLLFTIAAHGQYPKGAYMSLDEIRSKTPSQQLELQVVLRGLGQIKMSGGNDYLLKTDDKNIKKSFLKYDIWAYSDGENLYLNCLKLDSSHGYVCLIGDGRYMFFHAGLSDHTSTTLKEQQGKMIRMSMMFGLLGGLAAADAATLRFLHALDKETGKVLAIDAEIMNDLLSVAPDLQSEFAQEPDRKYESVHIKYLELLNERLQEQ